MSSVKADDRDEQRIRDLQDGAIMSDANLRAGRIAGAAADAIRTAASNENGVASSFMGLGMVGNLSMGAMGTFGPQGSTVGAVNPFPAQTQQGQSTEGWTCACGHAGNTGKFCAECGSRAPQEHRSIAVTNAAGRPTTRRIRRSSARSAVMHLMKRIDSRPLAGVPYASQIAR